MKKYCLALDLKDDPELIKEYEFRHRNIWPEIEQSIIQSGIEELSIYRTGNRLCMILQTSNEFSFERKSALDAANTKVQEWEALMWQYQQAVPWAEPGQKWVIMDEIFNLAGNK